MKFQNMYKLTRDESAPVNSSKCEVCGYHHLHISSRYGLVWIGLCHIMGHRHGIITFLPFYKIFIIIKYIFYLLPRCFIYKKYLTSIATVLYIKNELYK